MVEASRVDAAPIASAPIQIAEQIRQLILRGELTPGQQLPPDPELARLFGVGRGAVKTALDNLADSGLVTRPSQATRRFEVVEVDAETTATFFSVNLGLVAGNRAGALEELLEARRVLEVPAARAAASRASASAIEQLKEAMPDERAHPIDADELRSSRSFHAALLRAANNEMLRILSEPVFTILAARFTPRPIPVGYWDEVRREHDRIVDAIGSHDETAAEQAMSDHLDTVSEIYRSSS